jgi:hypothetical protein
MADRPMDWPPIPTNAPWKTNRLTASAAVMSLLCFILPSLKVDPSPRHPFPEPGGQGIYV